MLSFGNEQPFFEREFAPKLFFVSSKVSKRSQNSENDVMKQKANSVVFK